MSSLLTLATRYSECASTGGLAARSDDPFARRTPQWPSKILPALVKTARESASSPVASNRASSAVRRHAPARCKSGSSAAGGSVACRSGRKGRHFKSSDVGAPVHFGICEGDAERRPAKKATPAMTIVKSTVREPLEDISSKLTRNTLNSKASSSARSRARPEGGGGGGTPRTITWRPGGARASTSL
jgi:hypothetical protein